MAKNFSDKYIASLKPKDKAYTVREATGFVLKIFPTGNKTFLFIYEVNGKRKQVNLGNYPYVTLADARGKYFKVMESIRTGIPLIPETSNEVEEVLTISELVKKYLENSKRTDSADWVYSKEKCLHKHLKSFMCKPIDSFTKREAVALIEQVSLKGKGAAQGFFKIVKAMFEYALNMEYIQTSPFSRVRVTLPMLKAAPRSRFLTEEEIKHVWNSIDTCDARETTKRALKLVLVTAQRPGEVTGMHRNEISGDWWTIPAERAEKGKRDHRVFLTETAKQLIGEVDGYIFPSTRKSRQYVTRSSLSDSCLRYNFFGLPRWTPHDLRRTARTHMSRLRIPSEHAEAVLNHAKQGMVKVYDQYEFDDEKREALQLWEKELLRLVAQSDISE